MYITDRPTFQEVGYGTYSICCFGLSAPTLIVGEKKALLIDTGVGNTDLRQLIESQIHVPVEVAVTHWHADHVGGISQFKQVYVPRKEMGLVSALDAAFMQKFASYYIELLEEDGYIGCFRPEKKILPWQVPELQPIDDGVTFDLGGRIVTAYDCPVHSPGHMVFVDDLTETCFAGDALNVETGPANNRINPPAYVSLEEELEGLYNIEKHRKEFKRIIPGHLGGGGDFSIVRSISPEIIPKLISAGERMLDGTLPTITEETEAMGFRAYGDSEGVRLYYIPPYLRREDLMKSREGNI